MAESMIGAEPVETWAKAIAAASVLGGMGLERIGGYAGERARALRAAWADQTRESRAKVIARTVAELRAPVPANAQRVHRDWIRFDDARARIGWEERGMDPVGVWWQRRIAARWVALPSGEDVFLRISPEEVRRHGLVAIARVAMEAGDAAVARLAATMSTEDGVALVDAVRRLKTRPQGPVARDDAALVAKHGSDMMRIGAAVMARRVRGEQAVQARLIAGPEIARWMDDV